MDNLGEIVNTKQEGSALWLTLSAPPDVLELVVKKGSVTLDGVSLTVAERTERTFSVSLIPTTQTDTTLLRKRPGDKINLETDIIGKYVRALLHKSAPGGFAGGAVPGEPPDRGFPAPQWVLSAFTEQAAKKTNWRVRRLPDRETINCEPQRRNETWNKTLWKK